MLHDPRAIELVERIDYPFAEAFGTGVRPVAGPTLADLRPARSSASWRGIPDGTVVALGEGLETQFCRVDNGRVRWVTVDLPETVALREQAAPPAPRQR